MTEAGIASAVQAAGVASKDALRRSINRFMERHGTASARMVAAAQLIVDLPGVHYRAGGRGSLEFDSFGLARACAQAVIDAALGPGPDIGDLDIPVTAPGATEIMLDRIEGWGMRRIRPFDAAAGDIVIGRMGWPEPLVVTENHQMLGGMPCSFAHAAHVMPNRVPAIHHVGAMASTLFAAFTWRGTPFQPSAPPIADFAPGDEHPLAAKRPETSSPSTSPAGAASPENA